MASRKQELMEVKCPCCEATLWIDPELKAVIRFEEHKRPPSIQDMEEAVKKLRAEESKRDEVFAKSVEQHKAHQDVLSRKFDELFKQAKETPEAPPPKRPFDFD
jgi:predicted RNA-binding protein with PUA domain